jgi:two-component system OmpR family sensor kinase/two-component system sensor histidine kinase BaeS
MNDDPHRFDLHRRPYWWPENEPWPPERFFRPHRPRGPIHFRIGCLVPLFFLLAGLGCIVVFLLSVFSSGPLSNVSHGIILLVPIFLFASVLILLGGLLRRTVIPLDDVMDAADRVASGDYSSRLRVHGPPFVRNFIESFNTMTARLAAYDEQRKHLLADISHELRTPLTVLQGNLEGMLDNVYPRTDEHLNLLLEETRILSRLIEDLRTFSLTETGRLVLQKETCDACRLAADLVNAMQTQAEKAGVTLKAETESGSPMADMDSARIREVLENLVSNALRHTPSGGSVTVGCARSSEDQTHLEFRVEDTGAGIPAEILPFIFDRYFKSRDSGGTGLGLAIAKRLVQAHGGEIRAESNLGKGTSISFWIPM